MADTKTASSDLVMTQAELPPGIDVPSPSLGCRPDAGRTADTDTAATLSPEMLREIRSLAERVGGIDQLRDIVTTLAGLAR